MTTITNALRRRIEIDYLSVTVVRDKGTAARFTIGDNGGLLTETSVDFENSASVVRAVYEQGEPLYVDDLDEQPGLGVDEMLIRSGYRTVAVIPIRHGCHIEGVLTLAAREAHAIAKGQRRYIDSCLPAVGGIASAERYRFEIRRKERRGYILNNLMGKIVELDNPQEVFTTAANIIEAELNPSVVRVSSVDRKGAFLESLALQMAESETTMLAPARGSMVLSLMPYHQLVLETGRPMMINQQGTDRRMTEAESRQVFGVELNSALLVPVKIGSTAVGVISLAETREWNKHQYTQDDVQFVTAIASTLSVALQLVRTQRETRPPSSRKIGKFDPEVYAQTRARGRIKSSLTGIIGSVEFLKTHKQPTENDLEKCLAIIDKSARRIGEYVTTEVEK